MLEQLELFRALLSPRGTIFLHCDWHVSHYLRCLLDEVFGADAFKNEIVWRYRRWPAKTKAFQRMHDVLFWYGKTPNDSHAWTPLYESLAPSTLQTWGTKRQVADFSSGRRKPSQTTEETPGAPMSDVWDIGIIAPIALERVGYPTQKPEALLRRVIESASRPGDLVADFFAGSGTTLAVAEKLGRRWIGCDMGSVAVHTAKKRLLALAGCSAFEVLEPAGASTTRRDDLFASASVRSAIEGNRVTLRLEGASAIDFWSVDWDHDGEVFRGSFHASRTKKRRRAGARSEPYVRDDGRATHRGAARGRSRSRVAATPRGRLSEIMVGSLNHVTLSVRDLDRSFAFYRDTLGFRPLARWAQGAYLLAGEATWICLTLDPGRARRRCPSTRTWRSRSHPTSSPPPLRGSGRAGRRSGNRTPAKATPSTSSIPTGTSWSSTSATGARGWKPAAQTRTKT